MTTTDSVSSLAKQAASQLGWNPQFVEKQWALETGNFSSNVWKSDNNPAGIKWYPGMTYGTKGTAASDGGYYAKFSNPVEGYVQFVNNNKRYSNVKNYSTVQGEAQAIKNDGWATDPNYVKKILSENPNGNQSVTVDSSTTQDSTGLTDTTFGLPSASSIGKIVSQGLGILVGAGIIFMGIYITMNPLSDLSSAIYSLKK